MHCLRNMLVFNGDENSPRQMGHSILGLEKYDSIHCTFLCWLIFRTWNHLVYY